MILAKTLKGKGISFMEGKGGWHGKALKKGEELDKALAELQSQFVPEDGPAPRPEPPDGAAAARGAGRDASARSAYKLGDSVATREAYGAAIARLARHRRPHRRARRRREELHVQREVRAAAPGALLPDLHRRAGDDRRGDGAGEPRRDPVSRPRSPRS